MTNDRIPKASRYRRKPVNKPDTEYLQALRVVPAEAMVRYRLHHSETVQLTATQFIQHTLIIALMNRETFDFVMNVVLNQLDHVELHPIDGRTFQCRVAADTDDIGPVARSLEQLRDQWGVLAIEDLGQGIATISNDPAILLPSRDELHDRGLLRTLRQRLGYNPECNVVDVVYRDSVGGPLKKRRRMRVDLKDEFAEISKAIQLAADLLRLAECAGEILYLDGWGLLQRLETKGRNAASE